ELQLPALGVQLAPALLRRLDGALGRSQPLLGVLEVGEEPLAARELLCQAVDVRLERGEAPELRLGLLQQRALLLEPGQRVTTRDQLLLRRGELHLRARHELLEACSL